MKRTIEILAFGFALLLAACQTQGLRGSASNGEKLFTQLNCITCHSVKGVGGKVLRTSFDHTKEDALRNALAGVSQVVPPPA